MARTTGAPTLEHMEALILERGDITIGAIGTFDCVATAADEHQSLAMLVRRDRETLLHLLVRLDEAIRMASEEGIFTDEVNSS